MKSKLDGKKVWIGMSMEEADQLRASIMKRKRRWFDFLIPSTKVLRKFTHALNHVLPSEYAYA